MKELLKDLLWLIPGYLLDAMDFLIDPKQFMVDRLSEYKEDRQEALAKALTFAGVSFCFWLLLVKPLFPYGGELWQLVEFYFVPSLILLVALAGSVHLSWLLVGSKQSFHETVMIYSYYMGSGSVILTMLQRAEKGCAAYFDPKFLTKFIFPSHGSLETWYLQIIPSVAPAVHLFLGLIVQVFFVYWLCRAWGAYRRVSGASIRQSIIAFLSTMVLCASVYIIFALATLPFAPK
jgi:hypothetical protein